jgi:methylthioribulose-1-phosphate dehydratase
LIARRFWWQASLWAGSLPEHATMKKRAKSSKVAGKGWEQVPESTRADFTQLAADLADIGRGFYARGWALGTSGNFSAVLSHEPLRLAITSTGLDKSALNPSHFLEVSETAKVLRGHGQPSAEALIHLAIVRGLGAGAVLHTHSVWSTVLSGTYAGQGGLALEGYEMLKGLEGVRTHTHREWLPILENSQDMVELSGQVATTLRQNPGVHGFLLREHGLYTWGKSLQDAKRHVEILEFLMEVVVRGGGATRTM